MSERQGLPGFPEYLRGAITHQGFQTPTDFARAAGIHPSVVLRWLSGETRPGVPLLERVAPVLGTRLSILVRIAWPEIDRDDMTAEQTAKLHPLAAELDRRLGSKSTLPADEQEILARLIDSVLDRYRSRSTPRPAG